MFNTHSYTETSWNTVVIRGSKESISAPVHKVDKADHSDYYSTQVLYEGPELIAYRRSQKVISIIHTGLSAKSVIFEFPPFLFEHRTDAYKIILEQLGPVVGNGFNPISRKGTCSSGNLIISTEFKNPHVTAKAIEEGVLVDGVKYKATPFKRNAARFNSLIRVNFTIQIFEEDDVLLSNLLSSLSNYGKVYQIKKILCRNFFEGQLSVLLDPSVNDPAIQKYQKITHLMHLEAWDTFVSASSKSGQAISC